MLTKRDERGFTLVELTVAMTILLLVAGALLGALESGTNAERRASTRIDDEQSLQLVLTQWTRDVRDATSVLTSSTSTELDLTVGGKQVSWIYQQGPPQRLVRQVNGASGVAVSGLANGLTIPPFVYLTPSGQDLSTMSGSTGVDLPKCAASIEAQIVSAGHPPLRPFTESSEAQVLALGDRRGCP